MDVCGVGEDFTPLSSLCLCYHVQPEGACHSWRCAFADLSKQLKMVLDLRCRLHPGIGLDSRGGAWGWGAWISASCLFQGLRKELRIA